MGRSLNDLKMKQALPLSVKILLTKSRIREWVNEYGLDSVYVSFSGGKDSTVLLTIAREMYPDIKAVFVDTGLEYPEIRDFVRKWDNVEWLKPKMNFKQVIERYGYPFIGKELSNDVGTSKKWLKKQNASKPYSKTAISLKNKCMPHRLAKLCGCYEPNWGKKKKDCSFTGELSAPFFQETKWAFLLDAPFMVGDQCCDVMKKKPFKEFNKTGCGYAITAQMACESKLRERHWLRYGCNAFDMDVPKSNPMSFWIEQDVLLYIFKNGIEIAPVYGDVVVDGEGEELPGQLTLGDINEEWNRFDPAPPKLKTTGCKRTGCMFCGYGCHLEKPGEGRFERMKVTHPKQYQWIMKPWSEGGLGYRDVIDWLNKNGNLNIRY